MPETNAPSPTLPASSPDYCQLVQFIVEPLLESPESLSIDCETANHQQRVCIRVAFEGEDKGRIFGRGGRNLQAIRTVINTAALGAGQSAYLEIYETESRPPSRTLPSRNNFPRKPEPRKFRQPSPSSDRFSAQ
jgi:predicted RNA-binding protein YlqC (UPF0109 family)